MMPDLSGLDLSGLSGMAGGYSSGSYSASTPAYETYDELLAAIRAAL